MKSTLNNLVVLDASSIGDDLDFKRLDKFGIVSTYNYSSEFQISERIKNATIIVTNKCLLNEKTLAKCIKLKLICIAATGINNVDLKYCEKKSIEVLNVEGYSTKSVAQLTLTYSLHFLSSLAQYNDYCHKGDWIKSESFTHLGFRFENLENKKWGIIGLGKIGKEVRHLAEAFGAEVSYFSTSGQNENDRNHMSLDQLLKSSDIISIHCPLNKNTKNLIGEKELRQLKTNVILINVGRGGIINEKNLVSFMQKSEAMLATDVLEHEPMREDSAMKFLLGCSRVLMTPHIAWSSSESRELLFEKIIQNIEKSIKL